MKTIILFIITLIPISANAIDLYRPIGARAAALGRSAVCEQGLWALHNNPAGSALGRGWQCGLYYENQWLLKETAFKSALGMYAMEGVGSIGLSVVQLGSSVYNENLFGITYARAFGPYLQMGLRAEYLLFHWGADYPHHHALGYTFGLQSQLTARLRLGAVLSNPLPYRLKTFDDESLPVVMRFGFAYQFTDDFIGVGDVEYDSHHRGIRLGGGFEYTVTDRCFLRAGAQYHPNLLSFGVGYRIGPIHIDVSAQLHQVLGASVQVGIHYQKQRQ